MTRKKLLIMSSLMLTLGCKNSGVALQTYPLVDHQKTEFPISKSELNRIAVAGDRIHQVFGAEGLFDVQTDDEGGQIFLKLTEGFPTRDTTSMTVTIITEEGLTQDLKLIPQAIDSQSILFKPSLGHEKETVPKEDSVLHSLLPLMIAMSRNEDVVGYRKLSCNDSEISPSLPDLEVECLTTYLGEVLEGRRYRLKNQGHSPLHLKESDLANPEDLALSFSKSILHPGEQMTLYRVSRRTQ